MQIERLSMSNFKGFVQNEFSFHPEFNLVIGVNGTGKTSLLDALSVAIGSWFLGIDGSRTRSIRPDEVRLANQSAGVQQNNGSFEAPTWESQYPCRIDASGIVMDQPILWSRALNGSEGRTTRVGAQEIKNLASKADVSVRKGERVVLPLLSYYGTGRLWNVPRDEAKVRTEEGLVGRQQLSRFRGYRTSIDPRISVRDLIRWFARQSWIAFQSGARTTPELDVVSKAIVRCIDGAVQFHFDAKFGEVIVEIKGQPSQPFNNLSDGQRSMLALVGDIAQKAVTLNPHLGDRVLAETPGVVLIDELDLHLHPMWQRHIIEDLRTTFPKIQFICTTHSPFLIQSLRSGEELVVLDAEREGFIRLADKPIEEIARVLQGIDNPSVSARYDEMRAVARGYLSTLDEASAAPQERMEEYLDRLAKSIAPYADNPAYQAFLEMNRVARLGV